MKLFAVLCSLLFVGQVYCKPGLLGAMVGTASGVMDAFLGGEPRYYRTAPTYVAAAPAPAAQPVVNVNVRNVYNKADNNQVTNNNIAGSVNNNVVNNDIDVRQNVNNNAVSNAYTNQQLTNQQLNNYQQPVQYQPVQGYVGAGYGNGQAQMYAAV